MAWWHHDKFGMFIHWGLYAIPADGEWHMRQHHTPVKEYAKLTAEFNPVKFDADQWMQTAQDAGMKYLVFTSKHHDGFAMFHSKASPYNIYDATPFKRDPLKELSEACPRHGIRFGVYYSAIADWHHPGGGSGEGHWDKDQDGDLDHYLQTVAAPQVRELLTNYGPVAELWFDSDGSKGMNAGRAAPFVELLKLQPGIIVDPRLTGFPGDFDTAEQHIPPIAPPRDWECCMTVNGNWGFTHAPAKPLTKLLRQFLDVMGKGGNVLLNVGPTREGVIPPDSVDRLREMGAWLKANGESVYGSTAGPFKYLSWGRCTRKGNTLYLHVFDWPKDGSLRVPLPNPVVRAYTLADRGTPLKFATQEGKLVIQLPANAPDPVASVVAVEFQGEPPVLESMALGKPATASASAGGRTPENAVDAHPTSRWETPPDATDGWLQVDLGAPKTFATTRIGYAYGSMKRFALEYQEGGEWKTIFQDKDMPHDEYVKTFPPVTARLVRLHVLESTGAVNVADFELFPPE